MSDTEISIPSQNTLSQAAKLSIKISKPICFYFYLDSCRDNIKICTNETDKIIFKTLDEHTSSISNIYKVDNEYLIVTENTIYIWQDVILIITDAAKIFLSMAMAAIGLSTNIKDVKSMGYKPFIVGFIAMITVGFVSIITIQLLI